MEYTPRKQSFLNSTFCNQTHSPSQLSIDANRKKRFSRSNSHSHSKSKEHSKTTITTQTAQLYVKNICKNILSSSPQHLDIFNRISVSSRAKKQIIRRACTPAKSRPQPQKPAKDGQDNEIDAESELNGLKMQWQLRVAMAQKQRFQAQNKALQQKLAALYLSLADCQGQNRLLKEKVRYLEQRDAVGRDSKVNSANRIKRLIIENKELEKPTAQNMEQTIKSLIMQNQQLRQSAKAAENKAKLIEKHFQAMANERQLFLEDLVQQLKIQLVQKDNTIKNLMIQLNIFLVRQSHRDRKEQQEKVQEFQNIKRKYIHVLTKYHEVNQQLSAFKRKDERKGYLFNDKYLSKNSSLDSLQFSP